MKEKTDANFHCDGFFYFLDSFRAFKSPPVCVQNFQYFQLLITNY